MKTFTSNPQTVQRDAEIEANEAFLPPQHNYTQADLFSAKLIEYDDNKLVIVFPSECLVIGKEGEVLFKITPFDLKQRFGTKRRLYESFIKENLETFLTEGKQLDGNFNRKGSGAEKDGRAPDSKLDANARNVSQTSKSVRRIRRKL